ncbi:MAG: Outer membrane efflux protein BepC [Holosporales bacterium]
MMKKLFIAFLLSLPVLANPDTVVKKMTIQDALKASYHTDKNKAAREGLRAIQEKYVQERAGFLPEVNATSSYTKSKTKDSNAGTNDSPTQNRSMGASIKQNIFQGGVTVAKVKAADAEIKKSGEDLEKAEQESYQDAAQAFLDLIMYKKLIDVAAGNLKFVKKAYEDAEQKHKAGEETITMVEVAKAEYFKGDANFESSKNDLESKKADFLYKTTLTAPNDLEEPDAEAMLPKTLEAAQGVAENHYGLKSIKAQMDGAQANIDQATGTLLPKVDLSLSANRTIATQPMRNATADQTNTSLTLSAEMPLYEGGAIRSKIRQAAQSKSQAKLSFESLKIQIRSQVTQAWIAVNNLRSTVEAFKKVVAASQLAVNSLVEEQRAGSKTLLDVLDQQRKLVENQRQLIDAQNKFQKACFGLLGAMGTLNAKGMNIHIDNKFDKEFEYEQTKRNF